MDRFSKNHVSANTGELFALSIGSQISRNPTVVAPSESPVAGVRHASPTHCPDDPHCIHNGPDVGAAGSAGPRWPREFCLWQSCLPHGRADRMVGSGGQLPGGDRGVIVDRRRFPRGDPDRAGHDRYGERHGTRCRRAPRGCRSAQRSARAHRPPPAPSRSGPEL